MPPLSEPTLPLSLWLRFELAGRDRLGSPGVGSPERGGRADLPPSRRLMAEEALSLIAEDLAAPEQAAHVCERRIGAPQLFSIVSIIFGRPENAQPVRHEFAKVDLT